MSDTNTPAPQVARFRIHGKVYTTAGLDELTLKDVLLFESQARDAGFENLAYSDLERLAVEFADLSEDEAQRHPKALLMTAVTLWASRRASGEDLTFDEAISVPISAIEFLPTTEDHRPGPTQARKGTAKKAAAKRAANASTAPPVVSEPHAQRDTVGG